MPKNIQELLPYSRYFIKMQAEHYLSEGTLTRDMVIDYVKEVKINKLDDYYITWM